MNKQQTAVDWLLSELKKPYSDEYIKRIIEKAKQMEKEHIMNALVDGRVQYRDKQVISAEQYYNETYESNT